MNPNTALFTGLVGLSGIHLTHDYIIKSITNRDYNIQEPADTVSIINTSLNEEENIKKSLSSIRNQDIIKQYPEKFELILVDSGSIDNTYLS